MGTCPNKNICLIKGCSLNEYPFVIAKSPRKKNKEMSIQGEIDEERQLAEIETRRRNKIEEFLRDSNVFPTSIKPDAFDKDDNPIW